MHLLPYFRQLVQHKVDNFVILFTPLREIKILYKFVDNFMAEIQVGIEGEGAPAAAEALLEIPGISGSYEVPTQREGTLAAIATIISIVGGAVVLAEQIRKWY